MLECAWRHHMHEGSDLPCNHCHSKESRNTTEDESNDASCREASRQRCGAQVLAFQVEEIFGVRCSITGRGHAKCLAHVEVVLRDGLVLQLEGSLDHCGDKSTGQMPLCDKSVSSCFSFLHTQQTVI